MNVGEGVSAKSSRLQRLWGRRWVRWLVAVSMVGLVAAFALLESLRYVATRRGVEAVSLPLGSEIEALSLGADYVDAYRTFLPQDAPLMSIDQFGFGGRAPVVTTPHEAVFEGRAPGLRFYAAYYLSESGAQQAITLSTVVFYESFLGLLYFTPVKEVHRRLIPFGVSSTAIGVSPGR